MTYADALAYLETLTNFERSHDAPAMRGVRLERMRQLCERLGQPQQRLRAILVAGTNSKGSVCAMTYEILRAAGLRAGLYTSPHVDDLRERIRVGSGGTAHRPRERSDWISPEEFAASVDQVRAAVQGRDWVDGLPTYFEAVTAAALLHFKRKAVDVAVLEVGLGGRLDATNIVDANVCVLGPIGLDHTDVLGEDLESIAREKLGILRPGRPLVCAAQAPEVAALVRDLTGAQGCPLTECGRDIGVAIAAHDLNGTRVAVHTSRGTYDGLSVPLIGRHQAANAALAIGAIEALSAGGMPHTAVHVGVARTRWPGRLELVHERPPVLLDGAHNPQAAWALRETVEELWPGRPVRLIVGMSGDKSVEGIVQALGSLAQTVICTRSRHPRACDPERLAQAFAGDERAVTVIPDAVDAYTYALNTVAPEDLVVAMGSLFLVSELRQALRHAQHARERSRMRHARATAKSSAA